MAISYTWDVANVEAYPTKSSKSNVVHTVHWRLKGTDDSNNDSEGNPQIGELYGSVSLNTDDLSSFKTFSSLTLSDVQGWVEATIGSDEITKIKSSIDAQIAEKVTPTSVSKIIGS
tara:strand:- start:5709 stop:6056 length:348 start_codon:yes stop_codon:yes gene_type:complete